MTLVARLRVDADAQGPQEPDDRRRRGGVILSLVVALAALVLPPGATARWLVGSSSPLLGQVTTGVWIFKAALLAHTIGFVALARAIRATPFGVPLIRRVRGRERAPFNSGRVISILLVIGVATLLRLIDLGDGLWHDEIATLVEFGRLRPGQIIATYTAQNQHVLYSLLTSLSFSLFGDGAWALRLPAALAGILSLVAVYRFGARIASRREAVLAMLLLAVSYHHVWFSQNGRGYTLLMFFALVGSGLFLRLLAGETRDAWTLIVGYAIAMALGVYTHLTAAFVVAAHFAIWGTLWLRRRTTAGVVARWAPLAAIALAGTLSILLYSIVLPQMASTLFAPKVEFGATPWQNPVWLVAETLRGASRGLPGGWIGLAGGMLVAAAGVVGYSRRSPAATALMLTPALLTGSALIGMGHNLWPRFFFFSAGFAALIAVRGVFVLAGLLPMRRRRTAATVAVVVIAAASAFTVPRAWSPKQDYAGALALVNIDRRPGDAVVSTGLAAYAYDAWLHAPVTSVETTSELDAVERSHARTWFLYAFPTHLEAQSPELWLRIETEYREVAAFPGTVAGGTVHVMMRR